MRLLVDHLWSHILKSTTESISWLTYICLDAPAKVTDFDDIALLDKDILGFYISVDKSLLVHVIDTAAHLDEKVESSILP